MASTGTDAATAPPAATVSDTMARINQVCAEKGEPYSNYSCKEVAWEDAERGTIGGGLSSLGPNITDVRLFAKDGRPLYTVRTSNFDEKIGRLDASGVTMVGRDGLPVTLRELLRKMGEHGGYAGVPEGTDLLCCDLDEEVGIRFQTTFLPVDDEVGDGGSDGGDSRRGTLEFCVENYNYQTLSEDDPRNLLVLATAQGIAVQQDGPGRRRIYHHEEAAAAPPRADGGAGNNGDDDDGSAGAVVVHRHWLEAERTLHAAGGGPQEESEEAAVQSEVEAAAAETAATEAAERADRLREDATRAAASADDDDEGGRAAERAAAEEAAAEAERSRELADQASSEARRRRELREDALDAERRGKATSARIGTDAMGETCSAVLTVQVPLEQRRERGATAPAPPGSGAVFPWWETPACHGESIGIDLGTTHSCVGVWQNDHVEIISDDEGNRTSPSVVAFSETERLVGYDAESQAAMNPSNTIFDAKRLIGRKFSDPDVQSGKNRWPFAVKSNPEGDPIIEVEYEGERKTFKAEEISSVVLGKIREIAEAHLGKEAKHACLTVPAYFNDSQRQATKAAATMSGLNVLRIINEPTAAAIAYGLDRLSGDEKNVLVFDLGGGTLDVSILLIEEGIFEVLAKGGDAHLGGNDFDDRMVDHFLRDFQRKHGKDASRDGRSKCRLRVACERAKRTLSSCGHAQIEVDSLYDGVDYASTITRARFEDLCKDHFDACVAHIEKVLIDAKISKTDVDEIILVGGSTRIPKIRQMVSDFFDGKEARTSIDPETAVAYGAACQAAILSGADKSEKLSELLLLDVTPLSYGVAVCYGDALPAPAAGSRPADAVCRRVIPRNTTVPATKRLTLTTSEDRQSHVSIEIYQGERLLTEHNQLIARFTLGPLPPMPRGTLQIDVVFDIGADGILTVSASSGALQKKMAISDTGRLTQEDIERMVDDAQHLATRDDAIRDAREEEARLGCLVSSMRAALEMPTVRRSLGEERCASATALLDEAEAFLGADAAGRALGAVRERRARLEASLDDVRVASEAGVSNAARVSRGTRHDVWSGLTVEEPRRDASQHCTVTVTMYNTVSGGVPSAADVCDAIDDLERLYDACDWCGRLADDGNGAGIGRAKRAQVRRALTALAMAGHPRLGADSPARSLPCDVLLLHIGSFLVPELGKLQELTPQTIETIRDVILGTKENSDCQGADHISIDEID